MRRSFIHLFLLLLGGSSVLAQTDGSFDISGDPGGTSSRTLSVIKRVRDLTKQRQQASTISPDIPQPKSDAVAQLPTNPSNPIYTFVPPADPRFERYRQWFREHSVLSLVVSGRDRKELIRSLDRLKLLEGKKGVLIGQVIIVGGAKSFVYKELYGIPDSSDLQKLLQKNPDLVMANKGEILQEIPRMLADLKMGEERRYIGSDILDKLGLTYSPAWIVRYQGQHYIFEGNIEPSILFTEEGQFIPQRGW